MSAYMEPDLLLPSVNVNAPSLDAARVLGDRIAAAEHDDRVKAQQRSAASAAEAAIDAIPMLDFSPEVAARLQMKIRNRAASASWSHFKFAADALDHMDDAHDTLGAV